MTLLSTLNRTITAIRFRMARAAPLTVAGRRPVVLTEADLDACLERRRANRAARSAAARSGWATRRTSPLDLGPCSRPGNSTAGEGFGSTPPLYPRAGSTAAPLFDPVEQKGAHHG